MTAKTTSKTYVFEQALLPGGWARDVRVEFRDGRIAAVGGAGDAERITGAAVPGMPNLHCHSFQKGMAGLAERKGPTHDSFWTWREVMYRFLAQLTPDDVEAITAYAYMDMLESGYTVVGEFHYLHHDIGGRAYADLGEMAARVATAAAQTGIGLTLLPCLYTHGGFGGAAPTAGQVRFINGVDRFLKLLERARAIASTLRDCNVGVAPHSLRAVTPDELAALLEAVPAGPIHIHAAEQVKEVSDCVAALDARPVEWLLNHADVGPRWCLVHATHMDARETESLAKSGAVAGLCPLTEGSLGDGIFNGEAFVQGGGRYGIGSDSNILIDPAAELRQFEYAQRLSLRTRNVMSRVENESTGTRLYRGALAGGAQALDRKTGAIEVGAAADIVVLDTFDPHLAAAPQDTWLDIYVFVLGRRLVKTVFAGGEKLVEAGSHRDHARIAERYRKTVARLAAL
jgi:formiminoglutamate deiminase